MKGCWCLSGRVPDDENKTCVNNNDFPACGDAKVTHDE
jgi:hypothetical protein